MKTRKNTFIVSALVALLVVSMATVVMAQGQGGNGQGRGHGSGQGESGPEMKIERMAKHLDLSAEQVTAIKEIHESGRAENRETRKQLLRLRNEKHGEMLKDDPSTKKVLELTTEMGDLRTRMQTSRTSERLEVRKVLTPEQRDKMLLADKGHGQKRGNFHRQVQGRGGNCNGLPCGNDSGRGNQ
jgi:Spy/CpxP family protein refolding chaperone